MYHLIYFDKHKYPYTSDTHIPSKITEHCHLPSGPFLTLSGQHSNLLEGTQRSDFSQHSSVWPALELYTYCTHLCLASFNQYVCEMHPCFLGHARAFWPIDTSAAFSRSSVEPAGCGAEALPPTMDGSTAVFLLWELGREPGPVCTGLKGSIHLISTDGLRSRGVH